MHSAVRFPRGGKSVAIGNAAGENTQGTLSVAVGNAAGKTSQGTLSVAIGNNSASAFAQGDRAVAIGADGENTVSQGSDTVAVGYGTNTAGFGNVIALGSGATATAAGQFVLGSAAHPIALDPAAGALTTYLVCRVNGVAYKIPMHAA